MTEYWYGLSRKSKGNDRQEMKMKVSYGDQIWSMFQMVVLVFCFQQNVSSEIAQGCVGSQLSLRCPERKVIQITDAVLGDSSCHGTWCCIKDNDCTNAVNANHRRDVHLACSSQRECSVEIIQEKINCGFVTWTNNDFERITYVCRDDPRNGTPKSTDLQHTVDTSSHRSITMSEVIERHTVAITNAPVYLSSAILGVGIVGVVSLIITIGIVSVFVVVVRRKKRQQVKSTDEVKTVDGETDGYETIGMDSQRINIETPASEYCELHVDVADRRRVQRDSEYLQLYNTVINRS